MVSALLHAILSPGDKGGVELLGPRRAPRERPSKLALPNGGLSEWLHGAALLNSGWEKRPSSLAILGGDLEDMTAKPLVSTLPIERKDSLPPLESSSECCTGPLRPSAMQVASDDMEGVKPIDADLMRLKRLKQEHDLAKAVKSDNVEVPIHIWDNAICGGTPTAQET